MGDHIIEQLRSMADNGATQKETVGLMAAVVADIADTLTLIQDGWVKKDKEYDARFKAIEKKEKRTTTIIGIFGGGFVLVVIWMIQHLSSLAG